MVSFIKPCSFTKINLSFHSVLKKANGLNESAVREVGGYLYETDYIWGAVSLSPHHGNFFLILKKWDHNYFFKSKSGFQHSWISSSRKRHIPLKARGDESTIVAASVKVYHYQIKKVTSQWLKTSQRIQKRRRLDLTGNRIFLKSPNCYLSSCNTQIICDWRTHN